MLHGSADYAGAYALSMSPLQFWFHISDGDKDIFRFAFLAVGSMQSTVENREADHG